MNKMDIVLRTDFRDYYDHWFTLPHRAERAMFTLTRLSYDGMYKSNQFSTLKALGYNTVIHGVVSSMTPWKQGCPQVVVYHDPRVHRGEGKELMSMWSALKYHPEKYCSYYIDTSLNGDSTSYRLLCVGSKKFIIEYRSKDWRSNVNPYDVHVIEDSFLLEQLQDKLPWSLPLYSIDFVLPFLGHIGPLAVDLNSGPQIKGTGLEDILKPKEVFDLIAQWYMDNAALG